MSPVVQVGSQLGDHGKASCFLIPSRNLSLYRNKEEKKICV